VEVTEIVNLISIQIGSEFRKDLNIKKFFPVFYWPWAKFLPTGPAEPAPASLACGQGAAKHRSSPTPRRIATESEAPSLTEISMKPVKNRIPVELESLEIEPYMHKRLSTWNPYKQRVFVLGFRRKLKRTQGSPHSSPWRVRCSSSSINPTPVFHILCCTHLAQPCREPTLGAFPYRRRSLKLEPCRHTMPPPPGRALWAVDSCTNGHD
jgi:hypothetical protein